MTTTVNAYQLQIPYAKCEQVLTNGQVSVAVAQARKLDRTLQERSIDKVNIGLQGAVPSLKPGQIFREKSFVVDPNASILQRGAGLAQWRQKFKLEKTSADGATGTDHITWEQNNSTAERKFTIKSTGATGVLLSLNPWVINLQGVPMAGVVLGQMKKAMAKADGEFPGVIVAQARHAPTV